jgi:hypothetical protein
MGLILFSCRGGRVELPDPRLVLVDRLDGGNLVVNPPREVWERSELEADELARWSCLVAATGRAMIDALPQLDDGCVNYWEAGNWALNEQAHPAGPKTGPAHRRVHLHLLGRSRQAASPHHRWGEAPMFPLFARRHGWAAAHQRLLPRECRDVVERLEALLRGKYGFAAGDIAPWQPCTGCGYPTTRDVAGVCSECSSGS